jgi:hypothetical protein
MVMLTGCVDGGLQESPEALAARVTTEMAQYGLTDQAVLDCGKDKISIVADKIIHCTLTVPDDTQQYDVVVTITEADALTYQFTYVVEKIED